MVVKFLLLLLVACGLLAVAAMPLRSAATCVVPPVAAHKGASREYTQGTLRAFTTAYAEGARIWDTDVRFTRTGVPMILHDSTLVAFGSSLRIADVAYTYAKSLRASDGGQIMSLWDFTQAMQAYPSVVASIELKTAPTATQWQTIDARLKRLGARVIIGSFNGYTVRAAQVRGYRTGLIDSSGTLTPTRVRSFGTTFYESLGVLTPTYAAELRAGGVSQVEAWTPDTAAGWAKVPAGVVAITDDPAGWRTWWTAKHC